MPVRSWQARIHGPQFFDRAGIIRWVELRVNQPLILEREPNNCNDPNAIIVRDLYGEPTGYIERKVAAQIAPVMDSGSLLMAKLIKTVVLVSGQHWHRYPPIAYIWEEENNVKKEISKSKPKELEKAR